MTNPPPDPSHYPPPPAPDPGYYLGSTPGVYDPMSAPPTYTPPFTNPPPSGGDNAGMIIGAVIGGVCLIAIIGVVAFLVARPGEGGGAAEPGDSTSPSPQEPAASGSGSAPPVDPNADIRGDGTYLVGEDIEAGDYSTTVPDSSSLCYWERLKGTSGDFDDIIANGVADPGEKVTVTVEKKDEAFKSQGCGGWVRNS